jgi:hypothetical protein
MPAYAKPIPHCQIAIARDGAFGETAKAGVNDPD